MSKLAIKGNDSGTATFTIEAPATSTDRTLTLPDEAGTVLTSVSSIPVANLDSAVGITNVDNWSRTSTYTLLSQGDNRFTTNWTQVGGRFGAGMSESSGVFTFPSTGYWVVNAKMSGYLNAGAVGVIRVDIEVSDDSGSTYATVNRGLHGGSSAHWYSTDAVWVVDVTDASTYRVRFNFFDQNGNAESYFATGRDSVFQFIRVGDT
jgi:hypothetical protein